MEGITIRPATKATWPALAELFGPRGACAGCWCMWWRVPHAEFTRIKGNGAKRALKRLVESGPPPGILAFAGRQAVGWCCIAPRAELCRLGASEVLAPVDERPVWSIVCFFVSREARGTGLMGVLIEAAVAHARRNGAAIVEAYPVEPAGRTSGTFLYTGLASTFRKHGFVEVARRSATRPIMRRRIRTVRKARRPAARSAVPRMH